jgi:membrane protease YdiL (CAAX protease family)
LIFKFKLKDALPFNRKNKDNIFLLVIAGYSICTISNFAVSLLNSNLSLFNYENTTNVNLGADTLQDKILYFICIAIVPAITEEFCFRGVMLNYLRPYGDGFAILVSSIFFGLMHGNFVQIPFAFIVGLVCGYLVVHTNSMLPSILLHLLNNGTSIILDIVSNSTTEAVDNLVTSSVLFLLTLAGFIAIIALTKKGFKIKTHLENNNFSDIKTSIKIKNFLANPGIIIAVCIFLIEAFGLI